MLLFRVLGIKSLTSWLELEEEKYSRWPDQLEALRVEAIRNLVMAAKLAKEDISGVTRQCLNGKWPCLFVVIYAIQQYNFNAERSHFSRNCTKHHVKCDYMDVVPAANISRRAESPKPPNLLWTPAIEAAVDAWQQTNSFPFPSLHVWPTPESSLYSKTDLRLIHHLCQISAEMIRCGASKMTIWCDKIPQYVAILL